MSLNGIRFTNIFAFGKSSTIVRARSASSSACSNPSFNSTRGHRGWFVFSFIFGVISVTSSHAGGISKIPRGDSMAISEKNPAPPWHDIDVRLQSSSNKHLIAVPFIY